MAGKLSFLLSRRGAKPWASYSKGGPLALFLSALPASVWYRYLLATTLLLCVSLCALHAAWGGGQHAAWGGGQHAAWGGGQHAKGIAAAALPDGEGRPSPLPIYGTASPGLRTGPGKEASEAPSLLHRVLWAIATALVGPQHVAAGSGDCLALAALDATSGQGTGTHGQDLRSPSLLEGGGAPARTGNDTRLGAHTNGSAAERGRGLAAGHEPVALRVGNASSSPCVANMCRCDKRDDCPGGAVCVGGACVCPLLRSLGDTLDPRMGCREDRPVDANSEWCIMSLANFTRAHSRQSPPRMFALEAARVKGAPELDLPYLADWSTCAVVGNSDSLLKTELGAEIDAHSAVIRFNDAPTRQLEAHVGGRTTLRIQNIKYCGFHEGEDEMMLHYTPAYKNVAKGDPCAKTAALKLTSHFLEYELSYFHPFLGKRYSKFPKRDPAGGKSKLSGGFFGVALALHLCGTVDVYGFSQSDRRYYKKTRTMGSREGFITRHNWQMERACLNLLGKGLWPRVNVRD
eukprot:jgi/Mesvir1/24625/Mv26597-RA.1